MTRSHYDSYPDARDHLAEILDAAECGRVATVRRDKRASAVVDSERLRRLLASGEPSRAEVSRQPDGWLVLVPGVPAAAEGGTFEEAVDEMVGALREYAGDWERDPGAMAERVDNWSLVQLVGLSDDEQLRDWLVSTAG